MDHYRNLSKKYRDQDLYTVQGMHQNEDGTFRIIFMVMDNDRTKFIRKTNDSVDFGKDNVLGSDELSDKVYKFMLTDLSPLVDEAITKNEWESYTKTIAR